MDSFCRLLLISTLLTGLALSTACGRSDLDPSLPGSVTGGTTSPAGGGGTGGTGSTSIGGAGGSTSGICSEAPCLAPFLVGCAPDGSCTTQTITSGTAVAQNDCYANGVKQQTSGKLSGTGLTATVTLKRGSTICYSLDTTGAGSTMSNLSYVFRDASGNQVATGTYTSAGVVTIACNGATSVTLGNACSSLVPGLNSCAPGTCVF
jgi:hypothetical protein